MGLKGRKARSARRKVEKMKVKAMRRAQYESYAKLGKSRKRSGGVKGTSEHMMCGNPACKKCFVEFHITLKLHQH